MPLRVTVAALALWTLVAARPSVEAQAGRAGAAPPKLVVMLVVDQMRADYIDRFGADWTGGLKRLATQGARFTNAAYPYLTTVTCAGHATIATGAFPHVHGVIQNAWWDRKQARQMSCTDDPQTKNIGYGVRADGGDSAYRLQVPTFTDTMREERGARVVTLSIKDRSAIMLAGHGAAAATWLSATLDGWVTSTAYATAPVPLVEAFARANRLSDDYGATWSRLLPPARYRSADEGLGEAPPAGWTRVFPHQLKGAGSAPDAQFFGQWERSPFADTYLGRFAAALADDFMLGSHATPDVLAVSFSAPDLVGHAFGPRSQEVQDVYARLDLTIGALLDHLDKTVGRNQYVVALTADHGVTPIPEQLVQDGRDAGRISSTAIVNAIEERLRPALGAGTHIAQENGNDVYFDPAAAAALRASPQLLESVLTAVRAVPGVQNAFGADEVAKGAHAADRVLRAAALSYFPGRSGDIILAPKPGWMFSTNGTTHGSANPDDQRVPLLLFGHGIKPGRYAQAVTPADVAPTLAALVGVALPKAEGHALTSALTK